MIGRARGGRLRKLPYSQARFRGGESSCRLRLAGEPAREVKAGESFFEPMGAIHTVGESASPTEPAKAIAVMIVPDGAALVTPEPRK